MPSSMQMQSISGIITQTHVTKEEVPPPLVGASIDVIDDKVYVFAGRLATSRKLTNYLYVLDLNTLAWTRHIPPPDSDKPPKARYFHSTSVYNNKLVVFGGMGHSQSSNDNLCVLDDIMIFDIETMCWQKPDVQISLYSPQARYAHLSSVLEDKLLIIGGQDIDNNYLDELNVFNLKTMEWEQVKTFEKHVGAYRSVAVTAPSGTHISTAAAINNSSSSNINNTSSITSSINVSSNNIEEESTLNFDDINNTISSASNGTRDVSTTSSDSATDLLAPTTSTINNTSTTPSITTATTNTTSVSNGVSFNSTTRPFGSSAVDGVNPVYLYTNYSFTDVKRELQLIFPSPTPQVVMEDCSKHMNGSVMPPGLRFPTGHTLGNHLILSGTYLSPQSQQFTIWSLDLSKLTWSRIETGGVFNSGSWNRGALYEKINRFIVFGNTNRNLVDDYNHRQLNFEHIAFVDLEAFGVYSLPKPTCSTLAREMGLRLLNEPAISDFNIITQDNSSIPVNSAILCQRWPYFATLMKNNHFVATPDPKRAGDEDDDEDMVSLISSTPSYNSNKPSADGPKEESEETPEDASEEENFKLVKSRYMSFPYPHAVVIALLQFIYTDHIMTAQQYQPHILSQLLLLSDMYDIPRLRILATDALHQVLNMSTAPLIFETAALSHQTSLQIRALKMMIAAKKMIHQQQQLQQQQQQQQQQLFATRSRTASTPTLETPASPTTSISSSYQESLGPSKSTSSFDPSSGFMSPSLQTINSRKLSVGNRSTLQSIPQRTSTISTLYSPSKTYSPPVTPARQASYSPSENDMTVYSARRSSSPPPRSADQLKPVKEKKKKKAFLEAFKFSSNSK